MRILHIADLHLGRMLETGTTEEIFSRPLHPYTKSLLSAIPSPNPRMEKARKAVEYNYETSGIRYEDGTFTHIEGTHYVLGTQAEIEKWKTETAV